MLSKPYLFLFLCLAVNFSAYESFAQCNKHDTTRQYHMYVGQPCGIGINNNRIVVTSYNQDSFGAPAAVQVWNDRFLFTIGQPATSTFTLISPEAVTFDAAGNMYVVQTERPDSNIMIYNTSLALIAVIGNAPGLPAHWNNPRGMAIDSAGSLYVVSQDSTYIDTGTAHRTIDVPGTGKLIKIADPLGTATKTVLMTGLYGPKAVAIKGDNLYISEYSANRVSRYNTATLARVDTIAITRPVDLATTGCLLFCSEQGSHTIKVMNAADLSAGVQESIHQFDTAKSPSGIALDNEYNIFISDNENNKVAEFKQQMQRYVNLAIWLVKQSCSFFGVCC